MGYPDRGWLEGGARSTVPTPMPPTCLYPTRIVRTPQGVPCQQIHHQDPVYLREPEGLPRVPRPGTLSHNKREWPWWLGAPLRPQSTPNGGGSITLAAEMACVSVADSGRYGSSTVEDVWVPPTISYEREKITSKVLRDLGARDMVVGKPATSPQLNTFTKAPPDAKETKKAPETLDTSTIDKQALDPFMVQVTRRASTPALEHTYQYPDRSLRIKPKPSAFWTAQGLYSSKIPLGRYEVEEVKERPASSRRAKVGSSPTRPSSSPQSGRPGAHSASSSRISSTKSSHSVLEKYKTGQARPSIATGRSSVITSQLAKTPKSANSSRASSGSPPKRTVSASSPSKKEGIMSLHA